MSTVPGMTLYKFVEYNIARATSAILVEKDFL